MSTRLWWAQGMSVEWAERYIVERRERRSLLLVAGWRMWLNWQSVPMLNRRRRAEVLGSEEREVEVGGGMEMVVGRSVGARRLDVCRFVVLRVLIV